MTVRDDHAIDSEYFSCGHPARNDNTVLVYGYARCKICRREWSAKYYAAKPFRCGHSKTPENTYTTANGHHRCLTCKRESGARYEAMRRETVPQSFGKCLLAETWR